jgi:tetratricopeptide (TPR) repeat protein
MWLLPQPVIQPFAWRMFGKGKKPAPQTLRGEGSQFITLQIPPLHSGTGRVEVSLTINYVDGLPDAPPKIKNTFLEAQNLEKENKYREAIKLYEACFQQEVTTSQGAALHILIGNCFSSLSEMEEAEGHYRQAENLAKEGNDQRGLSAALGNMGSVYQAKGELDKALQQYQQALDIHRDIGNREGEANALNNMGVMYQTKGELDKALQQYQQALDIHRDIGNREGEAYVLNNMGIVYGIRGELNKALEHSQQALYIFEEIGARLQIEKVKRNIRRLSKARKHRDSR